MFRFCLICLLVVLSVSGVLGTAATAWAGEGEDAMAAWAAATNARDTLDQSGIEDDSVDAIAAAEYLGGLCNDPQDKLTGDSWVAIARTNNFAGVLADSQGKTRIINGADQMEIPDYGAAKSLFEGAVDSFGAAETLFTESLDAAIDAMEAYGANQLWAYDSGMLASDYWFAIEDESYGVKINAWCSYDFTTNQRQEVQDPGDLALGDIYWASACGLLTSAGASMETGETHLYDGDAHFIYGEYGDAIHHYDQAYDAFDTAYGWYLQVDEYCNEAMIRYFPE